MSERRSVDEMVERAVGGVLLGMLGLYAVSACVAAWFVPGMVAWASGRAGVGPAFRLGSQALVLACVACVWWLTPEPGHDESDHPVATRASTALRVGGLVGVILSAATCLSADLGTF